MSDGLRSFLGRTNSVDVEFMKQRAYLDQGILIVNVNDPMIGWDEKQLLKNVGNKLYGKGRPAGG